MSSVVNVTKDQILADEETIKDYVYSSFQERIRNANREAETAKRELDAENYEAQFGSSYASEYEKKRRKALEISKEIACLEKKPYFSHIKLQIPEENDVIHCLLSDCPDLDEARRIENSSNEDISIIPFRQDAHRKMFSALFSVYQAKDGSSFSVTASNGYTTVYSPEIIRDVNAELSATTRCKSR